MIKVVSTEVMRRSDAKEIADNTPSRELMRRAGEAVFQSYPWKGRTAIVCGSGNNAGDGYVLALYLKKADIPCRLILLSEKFSEDGSYYFEQCRALQIPFELWSDQSDFSDDSEIVDCIFGTGFHGSARGTSKDVILAINRSGKTVISVDINSGMNGDNGRGDPIVRSDLTVSVGSFKTGHFLGSAKDVIGKAVNADIGIPIGAEEQVSYLTEPQDFHEILKPRKQLSHKGSYGYVGIIGGCREYAGAAKLANLSCSALRAGCGVVTLTVAESVAASVAPYLLESTLAVIPDDGKGHMKADSEALEAVMHGKKALAVGMGWGQGSENADILRYLLTHFEGSLLIDADGLNVLSAMDKSILRQASCQIMMTPHPKEFQRISGFSMEEIAEEPIKTAQSFAGEYGVTVLLKGPCTVTTDGTDTYLVNRGCAGMATAGSGDVLSGILAGLLGYAPVSPLTAACGAYLAGLSGELAEKQTNPISMLSSDTVRQIPEAVSLMLG